jgi:hypothetical protein
MMKDAEKALQLDNLEAQLNGTDVPEKFRGKSVKDVLKSYSELETAHSRQGAELGEARRLAMTLSELEVRPPKKEPEREPVKAEDLLADPEKAISEAIETHPVVQEARKTVDLLERQVAMNEFERKHPSYREATSDPNFQAWIASNPTLSRLAQSAHAYDFAAADTLFSLWEEKTRIAAENESKRQEQENKARKERDGTLEGSSGADASSEVVLNRAELRELQRRALLGDKAAKAKWEDPKFQAMRRKAYLDKRVS